MPKTRTAFSANGETPIKLRPATTVEGRENQLVALAYDLAEQRLRDGTASSQEVVHFLKLGSTREQKELKKLDIEMKNIEAKTKQAEAAANTEKLYSEAIAAMRHYSGKDVPGDEEGEEDV